jgi:hypothetical protein
MAIGNFHGERCSPAALRNSRNVPGVRDSGAEYGKDGRYY